MKKILVITLFFVGFNISAINAQRMVVKSNLLYDATTTLNLGMEFGLSHKWTLDVPVNYNPWSLSDGARLRHLGVQPEARYWFCERFRNTFIGFHAHYAWFNVGRLPDWSFISFNMQENRYQGHLFGGGVSIGHSWLLSNRWSLEASVGLGYAHILYDKYPCDECATKLKSDHRNYLGPTKAAISLIYILK
ncbi:DUF3575 domain-containing protein [Bacteroides sp. 51]|uniref:DUF3575 domain-containing protein n=1 Tax=Bacteroides sp. 51 TaxID=2302938 RepID=UPI0013CF7206|nr:DUF3575 domain-containing protein [Bacteroides sp. 51]NDV80607.1 DUF3575 domain-containing protein [Bacteroides sp. 51]